MSSSSSALLRVAAGRPPPPAPFGGGLNSSSEPPVDAPPSPLWRSRHVSDVATDMFTMDLPSCMDFTSGSRPRLPTRMTLLTLPAIGASFAFPVPAGRRHLPHRPPTYCRSPVGSHRFWV